MLKMFPKIGRAGGPGGKEGGSFLFRKYTIRRTAKIKNNVHLRVNHWHKSHNDIVMGQ